jgi:SagB-type dehydrogenase family enzyme
MIKLPSPKTKGHFSVEEALWHRRSVRKFTDKSVSIENVSQLLWATTGQNSHRRTAPSAGGTRTIIVYSVIGNVEGVSQGVYRYIVTDHSLELVKDGDVRTDLVVSVLNQLSVRNAPVSVILATDYNLIIKNYGRRGYRYIYIEAGHMGQNLALQAVSLGMGTVMIGAFRDGVVKGVLGISEEPVYVIPVGYF